MDGQQLGELGKAISTSTLTIVLPDDLKDKLESYCAWVTANKDDVLLDIFTLGWLVVNSYGLGDGKLTIDTEIMAYFGNEKPYTFEITRPKS